MANELQLNRRNLVSTFGGLFAALTLPSEAIAQAATNASNPNASGDIINALEQDHRQVRSLLQQIDSTSDAGQIETPFRQLGMLLTVHNAVEENVVYPALQDFGKMQPEAMRLYQQQDQSKISYFGLDAMPKNSPQFKQAFAAFRNALLAHVQREEQQDFPRLRSAAGANLSMLTQKANQIRSRFSMG